MSQETVLILIGVSELCFRSNLDNKLYIKHNFFSLYDSP